MHIIRLLALLLLLPLFVSACASSNPGPAVRRVQEDVANRTGQHAPWHRTDDNASLAAAASMTALEEVNATSIKSTSTNATDSSPTSANATTSLTMEQALLLALRHNQTLQAMFEDIGVARGELAQATMAAAPVLSGKRLALQGSSPGWTVDIAMDLAGLFLLPLKGKLGEAQAVQAELAATAAILDCMQQVREGWYGVAAAAQSRALAMEQLLAAEAAWEMAQRLRQAGNITELELLTHRARYEAVRLGIAKADMAAAKAREDLSAIMGVWGPAAAWQPPQALPAMPEAELALDDVEPLAVNASLGLAQARQQVEVTARELGLKEWSAVLPFLDAGGEGERDVGETVWQQGPTLSAPIVFFTPAHGTKAAGRAALRRDWRRYQGLAVTLRAQARAARMQLLATRQAVDYFDRVLLPLQQNITTQSQLQYNAMQIGVFDLLDAKSQELAQRREQVAALHDYWLARSRMEQLLAGGWPEPTAFPPPFP